MICVVLNFNGKNAFIFHIKKEEENKIDEILINKYNLKIDEIEFMIIEDDCLNVGVEE